MSERISIHSLNRRQNSIAAAREAARGNHTFPELGPEAVQETTRVRTLLRRVGQNFGNETRDLSPGEQAHFVRDLADRSRELIAQEKQTNLLLGRLIRNGSIPLTAIHADGTFNTEELTTAPYFQENPHMIDVLNLRERQLAEKSSTRQKAAELEKRSSIQSDQPDAAHHEEKHAHDHEEHMHHHDQGEHTCGHHHSAPPSVETVMRNEVKTLGRIGNWWDRRRALRRAKRGSTPHVDDHLAIMQDVLAEEIPDIRTTMNNRQRRRYDRFTEEQQEAVVVHLADIKADRALQPALPRWWRNGAIGGNLGVGIAELFAGRVDKIASNESVTALIYDGGHNAMDAITYGGQADNVTNREITEKTRERRRKFIYQLICAGSVLAAAKSGYHIQEDFFGPEGEFQQTYHALIAGSASLTLNTMLGTSMYRNFRREKRLGIANDEHKQDLIDHMKFDFAYAISAFSAGLFASKNLQIPVEDIISGAISVFSAIRYRPTKKNLANAHTHNHDHGPTQLPVRQRSQKENGLQQTRRIRKKVAATVALASLAIGGVTTAKMVETNDASVIKANRGTAFIDDRANTTDSINPSTSRKTTESSVGNTSPTDLTVLFDKQTVQKGDTFWEIGEKQLSSINPNTNWVNPENGVTRNDVIIDLSRELQEKTGIDLDTIFPGDRHSLTANMQVEDIDLIQKILTTTSYEEYKKLIPQ